MNQKLQQVVDYAKKAQKLDARTTPQQVAYLVEELAQVVDQQDTELKAARADILYVALCAENRAYGEAVAKGKRPGNLADQTSREYAGLLLRTSRKDALALFDKDTESARRWPEARELVLAAQEGGGAS